MQRDFLSFNVAVINPSSYRTPACEIALKMAIDEKNLPGPIFTPQDLEEMAKKEINEDPQTRQSDIKTIKEWIKKQPHLDKYIRQDDDWILHFLRSTKFSLEKTKEKFENWNTIRSLCPEFFSNWDIEDPVHDYLLKQG